jgi:hypothetical protein
LTRRLGRNRLVFCDKPDEVAGVMQRLRQGQSLWEWVLVAVLVGLMLEAYLANCRGGKPAKG